MKEEQKKQEKPKVDKKRKDEDQEDMIGVPDIFDLDILNKDIDIVGELEFPFEEVEK